MKIEELVPGMLLAPTQGYVWLETPWRGGTGEIVGSYLQVVTERYQVNDDSIIKVENVLYVGTADHAASPPTPGRQTVLAWGKKMTVDPHGWRNIKSIS